MAEVKATDINSPKIVTGKNSNNKDAQDYSMKFFSADEPNPIGKYTQPKEYTNVDLSNNGYPETDVKTDGIEKRGVGAAQKGTKARGPMA
jgi:hypothetical protein